VAKFLLAAMGVSLLMLAGCAGAGGRDNTDYRNSNESMESAEINDSMGNDFYKQSAAGDDNDGGIALPAPK